MTTEKNISRPTVIISTEKGKLLDVVIPFHACYENVASLIENIFRYSPNIVNKVILVDDDSPNKDFVKIYENNKRIKIVKNEKNIGFGASVNKGAAVSERPSIAVLHSDVLFEDRNSLTNLYKDFILLRNQSVAFISAVSNNPQVNEKILKKNKITDDPPEIISNNFLPMYCCVFDLNAWRSVNGIPEFPLAWFEDEGFCYKLNKIGYKIAYSNRSYVKHSGSQTIKYLINKNKKNLDIMKSNINLLNKIKK